MATAATWKLFYVQIYKFFGFYFTINEQPNSLIKNLMLKTCEKYFWENLSVTANEPR